MRRGFVWGALILVTTAVGPAVALGSGQPARYRLTKGTKCRSSYVRQIRRVNKQRQVWCIRARVPTDTRVDTIGLGPLLDSPGTYWAVSGGIFYGRGADRGAGIELRGRPITYTIRDDTTLETLGSFVAPSNFEATCTIVSTLDPSGTVTTLTGQAVAPYAGCPLSPVSLPAADEADITGRFGGTSKYGPSVSFEARI
jgi:hypothetical protein